MLTIAAFIFFLLASLWRGAILLSMISKIEKAKHWDKIQCIVEDARYTDESYIRLDGKSTRCHFFASFVIDGVKYGCFNPSLYEKDKSFIKRLLERTEIGSKVDVFFDPKNPSDNVFLNPNSHGTLLNSIYFMISLFALISFSLFTFLG